MPSQFFFHTANVLAIAILISVVTAGGAIAASGIGHALTRSSSVCKGANCGLGPHQAKSAHIGRAIAAIGMRGHR